MSKKNNYKVPKTTFGGIVDVDFLPGLNQTYTSHGSNHYFAEGFYYTYDRGTPEYVFTCPHCKKETRYSIEINRLKGS